MVPAFRKVGKNGCLDVRAKSSLLQWVSTNIFPQILLINWVIDDQVSFLEQYYGAVINYFKFQLLDSFQHLFAEMGQHHFFIATID
jgi:hypothetical protein